MRRCVFEGWSRDQRESCGLVSVAGRVVVLVQNTGGSVSLSPGCPSPLGVHFTAIPDPSLDHALLQRPLTGRARVVFPQGWSSGCRWPATIVGDGRGEDFG